jgi:hypothetical protein
MKASSTSSPSPSSSSASFVQRQRHKQSLSLFINNAEQNTGGREPETQALTGAGVIRPKQSSITRGGRGFEVVACDPGYVLYSYQRRVNDSVLNKIAKVEKDTSCTQLIVRYRKLLHKLRKLHQIEEYRLKLLSKIAKLAVPDEVSEEHDGPNTNIGPNLFNLGAVDPVLCCGLYESEAGHTELLLSNELMKGFEEACISENENIAEIKQESSNLQLPTATFSEALANRLISSGVNLEPLQDSDLLSQYHENCNSAVGELQNEMSRGTIVDMFSVLEYTVNTLFAKGHVESKAMQSVREKVENELRRSSIATEDCKILCYRQNLRRCTSNVGGCGLFDATEANECNNDAIDAILKAVMESAKNSAMTRAKFWSNNLAFRSLQSRWVADDHGVRSHADSESPSERGEHVIEGNLQADSCAEVQKLRKIQAKHRTLLLRALNACKPLCPLDIVVNSTE